MVNNWNSNVSGWNTWTYNNMVEKMTINDGNWYGFGLLSGAVIMYILMKLQYKVKEMKNGNKR